MVNKNIVLFPDKAEQAYTKSNQTLHEFSSGSIIISIPIAYILLIKNRILSLKRKQKADFVLNSYNKYIFIYVHVHHFKLLYYS